MILLLLALLAGCAPLGPGLLGAPAATVVTVDNPFWCGRAPR